ncbi:mitochondrial thioredoxin [Marasmius sp. AFHP31]|nr:mitochondrial thioredoxin [Marasmius sp. AFHP31]
MGLSTSNSTDTVGTVGTVGTFGQFRRRVSAQSYSYSSGPCTDISEDEDFADGATEITVPLDGRRTESISMTSPRTCSSDTDDTTNPQEALVSASDGRESCGPTIATISTATSTGSCVAHVSPPSPSPSVYSTLSCSSAPRPRIRAQLSSESRPLSYSDYAGVLHSSTPAEPKYALKSPHVLAGTRRARSPCRPSSPSPSHNDDQLPSNLNWLRTIRVEMHIDQEGFRSVVPTFRFAGYSTNPRSLGDGLEITGGVAEFVPVSRQTFNFHYAPFEGQPILRRLTTNGEARDYISRQATLSIKSNGVYTVSGVETSALLGSREKHTEAAKLRWKLDYIVDDKRGARTVEGEKNFTPLAFCCSPLLLHPLQGKKIRLMHVVKKSVVMKLVAEKMEPPRLLPSPKLSSSGSLPLSIGDSLPSDNDLGAARPTYPQLPLAQMLMNDGQRPSRFRRRRASSGGEEKRRIENDEPSSGQVKPRPVSSGGLKTYRHILPPSKLSEMLDDLGQENTEPDVSMHSLRPPPRNVQR